MTAAPHEAGWARQSSADLGPPHALPLKLGSFSYDNRTSARATLKVCCYRRRYRTPHTAAPNNPSAINAKEEGSGTVVTETLCRLYSATPESVSSPRKMKLGILYGPTPLKEEK